MVPSLYWNTANPALRKDRQGSFIHLLLRKKKSLVVQRPDGKLDKGKQVAAIIPNVIHSLDAAHLMKFVVSAFDSGLNPVLTVHGCFGSHPNQLEALQFLVKLEFIQIYSNAYFLEKFHSRNLQIITDNNHKILSDKKTGLQYTVNLNKKFLYSQCPRFGLFKFKRNN